jgi:N-acetylglucosaminyl-diphospho-decaprenol L-rhamnosyltransferase
VGARIDVVVVSYNSRDTLRACVEPLAALDGVRVTVVDNVSSDGSLESVADLPVQAIDSGRNGGFGFGCNVGLAAGSAPLVLFVNPDARLAGEDLDRMAAVLEAEPDVAVVGPRLLDEDGRLMPSRRRYQRVGSTWATALFLHRVIRQAPWANEIIHAPEAYAAAADTEWLSGACLLARRSVLEALGGFDEGFFLYCEDTDLCVRLRAAGYGVRYEPRAVARHQEGSSAPRAELAAIHARSRARYARLHYGPFQARVERALLALSAVTHMLVTAPRRRAAARGHAAALRAALSAGPQN